MPRAPFAAEPGGGDSNLLNAPPPSPAQPLAPTAGMQGSVAGLSGMSIPSGMIPPEILAGVQQGAEKINLMLDTFAQVTPDLAADWLAIQDLLQRVMGKLLVAGAPAASPTTTGSAFPGGGLDRGGMA